MSCKSILVVEDDEDIRRQVVQALELENHEVHTVGNGQEALDFLLSRSENEQPGCIILDLMMPVMDGRRFMEIVNSQYQNSLGKIAIIVASAKGSPLSPELLPYSVERIRKPFNLDELYRAVGEHCGKK